MNSALRYGKQSLTWGVVVSTVAWSMGLAALLTPFTAAQAVSSGDLIKASQAAVYYYGEDGKRYVFPNQKTYNTWYSDFSGVITITDSELAAIPIGGNVTYKPGVKMVKITTDPKVYAVDSNGVLRPIADESTATALYGSTWNQQIDDVPDAFFTNYSVGAPINSGSDFNPTSVEAAATDINDDKNLSSGGTVGGGSLTVSLAADTPSTSTFPAGVSRLPVTKVNLTNNTALDAVVDQVTIKRLGIASNSSIASVDLLGPDMLPLNEFSKNLNSNDIATVNDDFTVPANSTLGVYIAINSAASTAAQAGELPVLAINGMTLKGGGQVTGSFPVAGNHHVVNGTLTIGTATVTPGANEPAASTQEIGTDEYIVTSFKVSAGSAEDITVKRVIFTQNSNADLQDDVENIKLFDANTNELLDATPTFFANDEDKFAMDINREIEEGDNMSFDLELDIVDGSGNVLGIDIDQQADLEIVGDTFGFNVLPTFERPAGTTNSSRPYFAATHTDIGAGTLRVESVSVTPTNISEGLDDTVIGKFKMVAEGENAEVTSMGWSFLITNQVGSTASSTDITNVTIREMGGNVVAGPFDLTAGASQGSNISAGSATTTDSFIVPNGETTYEILADLSTDFATDDKVQVTVRPSLADVQGETSGESITPTPGSAVSSTQLTIKAATLAVSVSSLPAAQTIVSGAQDFNAANIVLDGSNSGSDVRVTSVKIAQHHTGASFPDNLSGWTLWMDGVEVPLNGTPSTACESTCSTAGADATTTITINSGDLVVPKQSKTLAVTVDIGTGATSGTFSLGVGSDSSAPGISGLDQDGQSITPTFTASNGQAMTLASGGTLNTAILTDPKSDVVVAGSKVEVGRFTLQPKNEGADFNSFGIHVNSPDGGIVGNQDEVNTLELCQVGGSCFGPIAVNSNRATVTTNGLTQTQNDTETYVINATFNNLNDGSPAASGAGVRFLLGNIDVDGTSVGSSDITVNGLGSAFNTFTVYESIPTITKVAFSGDNLITGNGIELDLFKLSVSADSAGPVGLYKLTFGITTTTVELSSTGFRLYESDSSGTLGDILSDTGDVSTVQNASGGTSNWMVRTFFDVNDDSSNEPGREHRVLNSGSTKYLTLRGTVASGHEGTTSDNESLATVLAGDAAFTGTAAERADDVGTGGDTGSGGDLNDFVWSDLNIDLYSTTTATRAPVWFNGYRIPGLDNNSSTPQVVTD